MPSRFFNRPVLYIIPEEHIDDWIKKMRAGPKTIKFDTVCNAEFKTEFVIKKRIKFYNQYLQNVTVQLQAKSKWNNFMHIFLEGLSADINSFTASFYKQLVEKFVANWPINFPEGAFAKIGLPILISGASLCGIENEQLMNECAKVMGDSEKLFSIVEKRDRFIANQISRHLMAGDNGILFIGGSHHVEKFLPGSIKVVSYKNLFEGYLKSLSDDFLLRRFSLDV